MESLSPLIKRIKKQKYERLLKFLPRKGSIRFLLLISMIVFIIWTIPSFTSKPLLNTIASADDQHFSETQKNENSSLLLQKIVTALITDTSFLLYSPVKINLQEDSFLVWTTIDTQLQRYISKQFPLYKPLYGAFVPMDPSNGRILSLVSYVKDSLANPEKNLCVTATFPAASIYKTITAAAAIEALGYNSECIVEHRGRNHTLYHSQLKENLDYIIAVSYTHL
ncbi:MAG: penicillin-binding transpeptidase domain-containing protein, partial [Chitinispirillaceae bacterium]|nr:penicillin-binding transpeptidase domain-containing protein [Chitinispirillaceae bacterium]